MQTYHYPSTFECIRLCYQTEGFQGFYRGVLPVLASTSILRSLSFAVYTNTKKYLDQHIYPPISQSSQSGFALLPRIISQSLVSGVVSGSITVLFNAPIEFIKIQRQLERLMEQEKQQRQAKHAAELALQSTAASKPASSTATTTITTQKPPTTAVVSEVLAGPTATSSALLAKSALSDTSKTTAFQNSKIVNTPSFHPQPIPSKTKTTTWSTFKVVVEKKGFRGLYKGFIPHLVRDGLGTGLYFTFYESLKFGFWSLWTSHTPSVSNSKTHPESLSNPVLSSPSHPTPPSINSVYKPQDTMPSWIHLMSGGLAGTLIWVVIFPIDLLKSIVQREAMAENPRFHTARQVFGHLWRGESGGLKRLYKGLMPQLVRSFPIHALNFVVYERVLKFCEEF
ncbi:hypothetical protein HK098_002159 [Nowakowskiella sp. JEL0407]|nr:hypothetical protein HK098_002159 [Nowakowskiella sp. JEL0407]